MADTNQPAAAQPKGYTETEFYASWAIDPKTGKRGVVVKQYACDTCEFDTLLLNPDPRNPKMPSMISHLQSGQHYPALKPGKGGNA